MGNIRNEGKITLYEKDTGVVLLVEEARTVLDKSQILSYGGDSELPPPPSLTPQEEKRLYRKIDWHIIPIITMMYLSLSVDRSNIGACFKTLFAYVRSHRSTGNAKLQGLITQLDLTGNKFNIALVRRLTSSRHQQY